MSRFRNVFVFFAILASPLMAQEDDLLSDITEDPEETVPQANVVELAVPTEITSKQPLGQSWSVNQSFRVTGRSPELRSKVATLAGSLLRQFREELKEKDVKLGVPIHILLAGDVEKKGVGSPYRKSFGSQASGGYYVELAVDISRLKGVELRRAIMETITYAYALKEGDVEDDSRLVTHGWFLDGMLEVIAWNNEASSSKEYLELQKNPKLFGLDEIFLVTTAQFEKFDPGTRRTYQAASGAFVMALLKQENGVASVLSMLTELAMFEGDTESLLRRYFPDLSKGKNGPRVAWLLQLAAMSVPKLSEVMTMLESEAAIEQALQFNYLDEKGAPQVVGIESFALIGDLEEEERRKVIAPVSRQLQYCNNRCFPFYREIIAGYGTVLGALSRGETKDLETIITGIKNQRVLQQRAAVQARDFMDVYEIQTAREVKGDLDTPFDLVNSGTKESDLGRYLEVLDSMYAK